MAAGAQVKATKKLVVLLVAVVLFMFAFGYAMVPFYNSLCKVLGINGKTNSEGISYNIDSARIDKSRQITVEFLATNNENLNWVFEPQVRKIKLHPGEIKKIAYFAKNTTGKTMMVQAIPSVAPSLAAKYLKKTECFCFEQQTLSSDEEMDMPLLFHLDVDLPKHITTVTLSYTLFDVTGKEYKTNKQTGRIS